MNDDFRWPGFQIGQELSFPFNNNFLNRIKLVMEIRRQCTEVQRCLYNSENHSARIMQKKSTY